MRYERVCYMCPECSRGYFFDNSESFSTICPECHVEMVCVEKKFVRSEDEERRARLRNSALSTPTVYCPYCRSINTSKISTTSKAVDTAVFGIFGQKRKHQWHCNNCKSDF